MLKLNSTQINVIASKIESNLKVPIDEYNKQIRESEEFKNFYTKNTDCIAISKICKKYGIESYHIEGLLCVLKDEYFRPKFKYKGNLPSYSQIRSEVVLETIDCDSLDALIKKLENKWINK